MLTFYDFPAEHWKHVRTEPNGSIESDTFAQRFVCAPTGPRDMPVAQDGDGHGLQTMPEATSEKMEKTRMDRTISPRSDRKGAYIIR